MDIILCQSIVFCTNYGARYLLLLDLCGFVSLSSPVTGTKPHSSRTRSRYLLFTFAGNYLKNVGTITT